MTQLALISGGKIVRLDVADSAQLVVIEESVSDGSPHATHAYNLAIGRGGGVRATAASRDTIDRDLIAGSKLRVVRFFGRRA